MSFVIVIVSCKNTGTQVSLVVAEFPIVLGRAPEVLFSPTLEPSLLPFLCLGQSLCHSPCSSICVAFTSRVGDVSDHRPWFTVVFRFCMTFCECVCAFGHPWQVQKINRQVQKINKQVQQTSVQVQHAAAAASEVHILRPQLRYTDVLRAPTA